MARCEDVQRLAAAAIAPATRRRNAAAGTMRQLTQAKVPQTLDRTRAPFARLCRPHHVVPLCSSLRQR